MEIGGPLQHFMELGGLLLEICVSFLSQIDHKLFRIRTSYEVRIATVKGVHHRVNEGIRLLLDLLFQLLEVHLDYITHSRRPLPGLFQP